MVQYIHKFRLQTKRYLRSCMLSFMLQRRKSPKIQRPTSITGVFVKTQGLLSDFLGFKISQESKYLNQTASIFIHELLHQTLERHCNVILSSTGNEFPGIHTWLCYVKRLVILNKEIVLKHITANRRQSVAGSPKSAACNKYKTYAAILILLLRTYKTAHLTFPKKILNL